ncbi:hypothetical protein CSQ80_18135 [Cyanobacterium aponinum IPPAS B-1201]|nr:hypothetical protein CSQ80_18135 [Cyanobacterium aponinum IPPAS B-1201]
MITIYKKVFDELTQTITRLNNTLIQKLKDAPKVNQQFTNQYTGNNTDSGHVNINRGKSYSDSQDYIFGRLKRDAELGDERAIEVVLSKSRK